MGRERYSLTITQDESGILISWEGVADYLVGVDGQILVSLHGRGAEREVLVQPFFSIVAASALALKGISSFHGSSVVLGGKGVMFLGDKGQGKSTLAGALMRRHKLVSDDVSPVSFNDDTVSLYPGPPVIKLWPDAADALRLERFRLSPLNS
ncbi:MAG: hypothetical protein CR981_02535, partial [Proteobacteria bacterium]